MSQKPAHEPSDALGPRFPGSIPVPAQVRSSTSDVYRGNDRAAQMNSETENSDCESRCRLDRKKGFVLWLP